MTSPFGNARQDVRVLVAALVQGVVVVSLLLLPATGFGGGAWVAIVVALAVSLVWGSNTVAHIHLHTPLFHASAANRALATYLTLVLGVPQTWWKRRHLLHHGVPFKMPNTRDTAVEMLMLVAFWGALCASAPGVFLNVYVPAWTLAMVLCAVQGHYEHSEYSDVVSTRGTPGVDYHGEVYNWLWFNDGYHAQHHRTPAAHWSTLSNAASDDDRVSDWPPLLRWIGLLTARGTAALATALDLLEKLPLSSVTIRRFVLVTHRRALTRLLDGIDRTTLKRVCIVGGALFPRTALLLRELLPDAALVIVDANAAHVAGAQRLLQTAGGEISYVVSWYDPYDPRASPIPEARAADLLIIPLAYRGKRRRLYADPPAPLVVIHDWIWQRDGVCGVLVSRWLLKRVNLVRRDLVGAHPSPRAFVTLTKDNSWQPPHPHRPPAPASSAWTPLRASATAIGRRS